MQVTVRDLMTSQPLTVRELVTVEEATRKLLERAVSEVYVVDEDGRLLGTVSDFALLKARIIQADSQEPVTQLMSRNMVLLNPDMRLDEVAGYFRESCYPRLAVVEGGRVVGQLSRRDILRAMVVIEELAMASVDDDFEAAALSSVTSNNEDGRIRRLESPSATVLPEPAGLRSVPESDNAETGHSLSSLAAR
ncbi:MAG: CBS domain-containing protein [Planctomycetaceae bacterium]|jgi:CBS domain-containing protein